MHHVALVCVCVCVSMCLKVTNQPEILMYVRKSCWPVQPVTRTLSVYSKSRVRLLTGVDTDKADTNTFIFFILDVQS